MMILIIDNSNVKSDTINICLLSLIRILSLLEIVCQRVSYTSILFALIVLFCRGECISFDVFLIPSKLFLAKYFL